MEGAKCVDVDVVVVSGGGGSDGREIACGDGGELCSCPIVEFAAFAFAFADLLSISRVKVRLNYEYKHAEILYCT